MPLPQTYKTEIHTDSQGYNYESVTHDPSKSRIYTLANGLKVYLAQNKDAPSIQTYIAVKTGSANDPKDNTGLSHYLEHMIFKGTRKIGTSNWQEESKLLDQISGLYEQHKAEINPEKKKEIYKDIDKISLEASKYAIANEYDKMLSSLGAKGTNAHTWLDETIYKNNIPSNELEKWLYIEKERFSEVVLRLFHTELETVYEEFNRAQDNDAQLVNYELMDALFPTHPYGQQTTLGKAEHLKNPSMKAIHEYFNTYYVANNMAIILVGDLDYEPSIQLIDKYFGSYTYKKIPEITRNPEQPITSVVRRTVNSPSAERLQLAFRTEKAGSKESLYIQMVDMILNNSGAGLIDININQKQKAQGAGSYSMFFKEYGMHSLYGTPREGQSLQEVEKLLLNQLEKIKKGEFEDWIIQAIINDFKTRRIENWDQANGIATQMYTAFIQEQSWESVLNKLNKLNQITKEDIVAFANKFYTDNYVIVYKEKGTNDLLIRVENPEITPVTINREDESEFYKQLASFPETEITPEFINYKEIIDFDQIKDSPFYFIKNKNNPLAKLFYIFDFGVDNSKELTLALNYLNLLGTDKFSKSELEEGFYKTGVSYTINILNEKIYLSLSGLAENMSKGIELLEHFLSHAQADPSVYQEYVQTILKARKNSKTNKQSIFKALIQYARYGEKNRIRNNITEQELLHIQSEELSAKARQLFNYKHSVFYYGPEKQKIKHLLEQKHHFGQETFNSAENYEELPPDNTLYFAPYDMVQTEISFLSKGNKSNVDIIPFARVFNEYFGSGLSSIVFQEIRESKSLAYTAYAIYSPAVDKDKYDFISSYLGTQADKLPQAVQALSELMGNMPEIEKQFENAKNGVLKQIASERINKTNIFWSYLSAQKLGIDYDLRKNVYQQIQPLQLADLQNFVNKELKNRKYNIALIGKKESIDWDALKPLRIIQELSIDELFNY